VIPPYIIDGFESDTLADRKDWTNDDCELIGNNIEIHETPSSWDGKDPTINGNTFDFSKADSFPSFKGTIDQGKCLIHPNQNKINEVRLTNLWMWSNYLHDLTYLFGFREGWGNFQGNNYGKGGKDGDPLRLILINGLISGFASMDYANDGKSENIYFGLTDVKDHHTADDPCTIIHEFFHAVVSRVAGPPQGHLHSRAIYEAIADIGAVLITETTVIGQWINGNSVRGIRTSGYGPIKVSSGSNGRPKLEALSGVADSAPIYQLSSWSALSSDMYAIGTMLVGPVLEATRQFEKIFKTTQVQDANGAARSLSLQLLIYTGKYMGSDQTFPNFRKSMFKSLFWLHWNVWRNRPAPKNLIPNFKLDPSTTILLWNALDLSFSYYGLGHGVAVQIGSGHFPEYGKTSFGKGSVIKYEPTPVASMWEALQQL